MKRATPPNNQARRAFGMRRHEHHAQSSPGLIAAEKYRPLRVNRVQHGRGIVGPLLHRVRSIERVGHADAMPVETNDASERRQAPNESAQWRPSIWSSTGTPVAIDRTRSTGPAPDTWYATNVPSLASPRISSPASQRALLAPHQPPEQIALNGARSLRLAHVTRADSQICAVGGS